MYKKRYINFKMGKIYQHLKITFLICSFAFISSCKKETGDSISFYGRIIDAQTMQPIPNYPLSLKFIDGDAGIGFNLGSYYNIANCNTNVNGEYILTTKRIYAQDSTDYYVLESLSSNNYFGLRKELNAKNAELLKSILIDNIKVYKMIIVNFYIHHLGVINANNFILIDINGVYNYGNDGFHGTDSVQQNSHEVVPNSRTAITWRGVKNNIHFGPITDTVIFTNSNNTYNISY